MKEITPSKNRAVVRILAEANEKITESGIIIPEAKNVTKEMAIGEIIAIDDPDDVSRCKVGDKAYFRSMACGQCGDGLSIVNVNQIDGKIKTNG